MEVVWSVLGLINGKTLLIATVVGIIAMVYLIKTNP